MFYQVVKKSSTNCCGSTCCDSEIVIWETDDPQKYASKVFADLDRENVSIYLMKGPILHFRRSDEGKWFSNSGKIVLDLGKTSSTIGYDFVHEGESRTFTAKPGYLFSRVFLGGSVEHTFWKARTEWECSNKVTVYGVETSVKNINIFINNNRIKHLHKVEGEWVSTTTITLDIETNTDNDLFEYRSTRNFGHFNPKPNLTITKIVKSDLVIWTAKPGDRGLKAVLMGSGKDEKHLSILLQSGNFVLLRKCGKGLCWEDITKDKSDFSDIKMYSLEEGTSNYHELTETDYDPIIFESRYGYEFKEGVKCVKITYNNKLLWNHTDDPEFGYLKGLYLDLPKDQFSVTNLKDQTKHLTKIKIVLDIEKSESDDEFGYFNGVITYTPRSDCVFKKITHGTTVIWESKDNVFGTLLRTKTMDSVKYLAILLDNNMFSLFKLEDGDLKEMTSERRDVTKLRFIGENDAELISSDYKVTIVDYAYQYTFNDGIRCRKITYNNIPVWKPTEDPKFSEIKKFRLGLISNNFYVLNESELKKLEFKPTPETADVTTLVSVTKPAEPTKVTLDIEKTDSTNQFDYSDHNGVITYTPKDNHVFSKVSEGTKDIWESKDDVFGTLVRTKTTKGVKYLVVLMNNKFTLFNLDDDNEWKDITSDRHDVTKIKIFGEGDTELSKTDYTTKLRFISVIFQQLLCENLKTAAGASATTGTLRALAGKLHDKANELHQAVTSVSNQDAARVLRHKAGKDQNTEGKLRKLAKTLYDKANELESAAPAKGDIDGNDLKQKAGTSEDDGLRKLAKTLYEAAKALQDTKPGDESAANNLARAVGQDEETPGIRQALKELATAGSGQLSTAAGAVRDAYDKSGTSGVKPAFNAVETQNSSNSAYANEPKQSLYQAVVKAWNAFNDLYTTNLKQLANDLKEAVGGTDARDKLQKTLQLLGDLSDTESGPTLTGPAGKVKNAYKDSAGTNGVKPKFDALKAKESSYQAIAAIKPKYDNVVSAMDAFNNVYKPEELLKEAIGDGNLENSGLQKALKQLHNEGTDPGKLPDLVKAVKTQYSENWGSTVKSIFELVQAQADAYKVGEKTTEYKELLDAWTNFNNKYHGVISYYKYYSIVHTSIFTMLSDCSHKTDFVWHGVGNPKTGFGGWRKYASEHKPGGSGKCDEVAEANALVHGWIWHFFDILMILMIILGHIFIYSLHYRDSKISRSIVNQPKMSTTLTIILYIYNGSH